jgi:hypothetical protein
MGDFSVSPHRGRRFWNCRFRSVGVLILVSSLSLLLTSCQLGPSVTTRQLLAHQAFVDFTGLAPSKNVEILKVAIAPPRDWEQIETKKSALYTHLQWRSPSHANAVGVAYLHLPIALSAKTIAWLAKREYTDQAADGKLLGEWTDSLNRPWFEAENNRYHVRGYVITRGSEAWIVYYGFKLAAPPDATEMSLAARSMETIVPLDSNAPAGETAQASAK